MLKQVQHDTTMSSRNKFSMTWKNTVIPNLIRDLHEERIMTDKAYVYFMTNKTNTVLYIGVTSDLQKRVNQHKNHEYEGFTDKYNCTKLVYFEECNDIKAAIAREKQLKNWHRDWKNNLVNQFNKDWKDLSEDRC